MQLEKIDKLIEDNIEESDQVILGMFSLLHPEMTMDVKRFLKDRIIKLKNIEQERVNNEQRRIAINTRLSETSLRGLHG